MPYTRWTYNVPGPIREDDPTRDLTGGHPTAPGKNDPYIVRRARAGASGIGNGVPGIPRLIPGPKHTEPIPANFGRPIQPGTNYNNGSDISGP